MNLSHFIIDAYIYFSCIYQNFSLFIESFICVWIILALSVLRSLKVWPTSIILLILLNIFSMNPTIVCRQISKYFHQWARTQSETITLFVQSLFSVLLSDRDRFQLGTLSHSLNVKAAGYQELSDWPAVAPDQSVRNVEVIEPVRVQPPHTLLIITFTCPTLNSLFTLSVSVGHNEAFFSLKWFEMHHHSLSWFIELRQFVD